MAFRNVSAKVFLLLLLREGDSFFLGVIVVVVSIMVLLNNIKQVSIYVRRSLLPVVHATAIGHPAVGVDEKSLM